MAQKLDEVRELSKSTEESALRGMELDEEDELSEDMVDEGVSVTNMSGFNLIK